MKIEARVPIYPTETPSSSQVELKFQLHNIWPL